MLFRSVPAYAALLGRTTAELGVSLREAGSLQESRTVLEKGIRILTSQSESRELYRFSRRMTAGLHYQLAQTLRALGEEDLADHASRQVWPF